MPGDSERRTGGFASAPPMPAPDLTSEGEPSPLSATPIMQLNGREIAELLVRERADQDELEAFLKRVWGRDEGSMEGYPDVIAGGAGGRDPLYGPRLSDDIDALSSTMGWGPWMRLFRRHEQRLVDRRRAAREPQEPVASRNGE